MGMSEDGEDEGGKMYIPERQEKLINECLQEPTISGKNRETMKKFVKELKARGKKVGTIQDYIVKIYKLGKFHPFLYSGYRTSYHISLNCLDNALHE